MYIPSDKYLLASKKLSHIPKSKIEIDGIEYTGMDVIKNHPNISHQATKMIGDFPTKECSITIFNRSNDINVVNKEIKVYRGLTLDDNTTEYIPQGIFVPKDDDVKTNSTAQTIEIKMKDKSTVFDTLYGGEDNVEYPCTLVEFVEEICNRHNIELETKEFPFFDLELMQRPNFDLNSVTERSLIASAAELGGCNVQMSRFGGVRISKPTKVNQTIKKLNYKSLSSKENIYGPINSVVLGNKGFNNDIVAKDDSSISQYGLYDWKLYDNPYVDLNKEEMVDLIAEKIYGMTIIPFKILDTIDSYLYDLNDEVEIEDKQGNIFITTILEIESSSRIYTKLGAPVQKNSQTDYKIAGSSKAAIEQVKLDVDHVKQEILLQASKISDNEEKITQIEVDTGKISQTVTNVEAQVTEITANQSVVSGNNILYIDNALPENALEYRIYGKCEQKTRKGYNVAKLNTTYHASQYSYTSLEPNDISVTKNATGGIFFTQFSVHIDKAGSYTITFENVNEVRTALYFYEDKLWGTSVTSRLITTSGNQSLTIDFQKTGTYILGLYNDEAIGTNIHIKNFMMKLSSITITDYEQYWVSPSKEYPSAIHSIKAIKISLQKDTQSKEIVVDMKNNELCSIGTVCDELEVVSGTLTKRIGKIESYNNETIVTNFISTTGDLHIGSTVYYELAEPYIIKLEPTNIELFENTNRIELVSNLDTNTSVKYLKNTVLNQEFSQIKNSVENLASSTNYSINIIQEQLKNGVTEVKTNTGFEFNDDGLNISKTDAPTGSTLDEAGLEIIDKTGSSKTTQFYSGYVTEELGDKTQQLEKYVGQTVSYSANLIFSNYFSSKNWRIEEIKDSKHGTGLGFFYIGDD